MPSVNLEILFNEALEAGSTNPLTYYYLGQAHYERQEYADAYKAYEKVSRMDPLNGMIYVRMARCKARMDAEDEEVERLRALALEVDPDNYSVLLEIEILK